jgi:hypothetical protein
MNSILVPASLAADSEELARRSGMMPPGAMSVGANASHADEALGHGAHHGQIESHPVGASVV